MLCSLFVFAQSYGLKSYIDNAAKTNALMRAKNIQVKARKEQIEAAKSAYWPTLDAGGSYALVSPNSVISPGRTGTLQASAYLDLYDGGRKEAIVKSREFEHEAALFEEAAFEKSITLEIVRHYYTIQKYKATLNALKDRASELKAQIQHVKKFKGAGLSTQEDIDKLVAVYENNNFTIENTKFARETSEENLQLISGLSGRYLKRNYFIEPRHIDFETFETIKVLQSRAQAIGENANAIDAGYLPQVNISDTYHRSHFDDTISIPGASGFLIDHQNKLGVTVHIRIFDHGKMEKESEAIQYQKLSLLSEIDHAKREQKMHFKLAKKSLKTTRIKLTSAKSALVAAKSTYNVIRQKFEVGLVDNIAFLDALSQKTLAYARYKETVYDYEIRKSIYYYYAGKDPKEFIR